MSIPLEENKTHLSTTKVELGHIKENEKPNNSNRKILPT